MKINILEKIFNWGIGIVPSFIIYFIILFVTSTALIATGISTAESGSLAFWLSIVAIAQMFIAVIYASIRK